MKTFEKVAFAIAFVIAFLGIIHLGQVIVSIVLSLILCIYLFAGWYILLPEDNKMAKRLMPFIVSYLIAQTFAVLIFGINNWPLKEIFSYITLIMIVLTIVVLIVFKKRFSSEYPVNGYILRLFICFLFSGAPVWM